MIRLYDYQLDAITHMKNGCILNGGVGSGKSLTSLGYYYLKQGGNISSLQGGEYIQMRDPPKNLYIITTAHKRDTLEWEKELIPFFMSTHKEHHLYSNQPVIVDSWNNIEKYENVKRSFFIFDEQRVVGYGKWSRTFIKISRSNDWILLSATPGDRWEDYIPVFIANGFYRTKKEFEEEHLVYSRYVKWKVYRYLNVRRLERLRKNILVDMDFERKTIAHHEDIYVDYDILKYKQTIKNRVNPYTEEPIQQASELCYVLRRIVNSDESRQVSLLELFEKHPKMIVFYNFDYELDILKNMFLPLESSFFELAEWNGHKHQPIPESESWIYLVQYTAGAEGWNCITTDTVVFYSQNYSYKTVEQSSGRIDRLNTPYTDLYYYHLKTRSGIDLAISKALKEKKKFNERGFADTNLR